MGSMQPGLQDAAKAILMLRSEMAQREARMNASFNQQVQSLREDASRFRRDVADIVSGAGSQIAKEAKGAISPVAAEYDRAVSTTSAHLQEASKTVWLWFGAAGSILLLVLLVGWAVLGYYRRELSAIQDELQRYENALPIVQAFTASDAVLCGGRVCVNIDPDGQRIGDKRQYRQARPRP
ncbi:hypothetical protein [Variovorax sp. Sphag1AA]|uniref:hypothetical protein n=1 Tax=Variovorax sp. Sphag1AA TaxID=2587027 RepID=UPI001C8479AF|nr:hypothetical protein [Variovorax sp. Sphag1AA]